MKLIIAFLINLQFFTVVPVRTSLPLDAAYIKKAVQSFPLLGLLQGAAYAGVLYLLLNGTPFSQLATAFLLWLLTILLTGGLHLDGWMDASDAFFSYRDIEKRLEIMKDPRIGAFGVLSVIVLLSSKFIFIYEIIGNVSAPTYIVIIAIPFLSRQVMGYLLIRAALAKQEGLAYFFQQKAGRTSLIVYMVYTIVFCSAAYLLARGTLLPNLIMLGAALLLALSLKKKVKDWFGGITGDVIGASVEGTELALWMIVWLLHYFVMA
ncbi:adenosylcobinamide-GDP ribazoletransferase [Peribacillus saganii]|uniref:Adenosylcobinamide-GDP ribazoletransferase n=1 Tax=Peribacillus saganii TaxID=2303992 RepID=A0A372LUD7_9BACI|nr:adenosylcobinamide-GDP ribazoletransferase [Peribacillus saganii]RFU71410.1 adenosylcobinamide-GDP ribazoletransferase [Peribacillus saganii]